MLDVGALVVFWNVCVAKEYIILNKCSSNWQLWRFFDLRTNICILQLYFITEGSQSWGV